MSARLWRPPQEMAHALPCRPEPGFEGEEHLGYAWIEVLAVQIQAINGPNEHGIQTVRNGYISRTSSGMCVIPEEDFWEAIERGEYAV